jgi:ubiquinone/menaquinone biosynthesis C-methylase UbiE
MGLASWLLHRITFRNAPSSRDDAYKDYDYFEASTERFVGRFGSALDFSGKSVLEVGCGSGVLCIEAAKRGASRVVGIDIEATDIAFDYLQAHHPECADRVRFIHTDGSLNELGDESFDIVLSKDSFEHYRDPDEVLAKMTRLLRPGGELVIGFGPLWKSPFGGHIWYMTKVPWAHLIFPEDIIMAERRRFRPAERATRFADVAGGLNKMTLGRFRALIEASGLECTYWGTNVSAHPAVRAMNVLSRVSPLREYFTNSVYTIWRKPPA